MKAVKQNEVIENYDALDYPEGVMKVREIAPGVFMRPRKHWAMNSYAGEGIVRLEHKNGYDRSGCLHPEIDLLINSSAPWIVTARIYWSKKGIISCFLSYPKGMGAESCYFWEIFSWDKLFDGIERFYIEEECERRIIELLGGEG